MAIQARAEVTRQSIIDAAVSVFDEVGYGKTGLSDIMSRAGVTKGGFYYHFATKDAVAAAIIEEAAAEIRAQFQTIVDSSSSPALDNLIRASFYVVAITATDNRIRVANMLRQSLTHVSDAGPASYPAERANLLRAVEKAMAEGGLQADVDPDAVAQAIWTLGPGTLLLAEATGDDVFARLAQVWTVLLRGMVVPELLTHTTDFVDLMTRQHSKVPRQR